MGFARELWGQYQALVDGPIGAVVEGVAYEVESEEDVEKLAYYETNAYRAAPCVISPESPSSEEEPQRLYGKTFVYAGDAQALKEKKWDRKLWMMNMGSKLQDVAVVEAGRR